MRRFYHGKLDHDLTEAVGSEDYKFNEKNMTSHTWRTIVGLAIVAIIGGLQALNGVGGFSAWITLVVPILLALEHALAGNTTA